MQNVAQKFAAETGWDIETENNRISARCPAFLNAYFDIFFQTSNQQDEQTSSFCFEIADCPKMEDRDFRVCYSDAVRLAKLINEIYGFMPKTDGDFQPLVIDRKINFPDLNRDIDIQFEDGEIVPAAVFIDDSLHRIDKEHPSEVAIFYCGRRVFLNPNLKWRYAGQAQ